LGGKLIEPNALSLGQTTTDGTGENKKTQQRKKNGTLPAPAQKIRFGELAYAETKNKDGMPGIAAALVHV
jgi:hypothetical protein